MIDFTYPSKHETLRVIRGMAYKSLKLPFPETMVETPMPQSSSAALQGVETANRVGEAEWIDGEWRVFNSLSQEGRTVWDWLKGASVTPKKPSASITAYYNGVSQTTALKILRLYRTVYGIE